MGVNNMTYSIKRKQKKAIKSPYLGILFRNVRRDIIVSEYLYYINNKIDIIFLFNTYNISLYLYNGVYISHTQ